MRKLYGGEGVVGKDVSKREAWRDEKAGNVKLRYKELKRGFGKFGRITPLRN